MQHIFLLKWNIPDNLSSNITPDISFICLSLSIERIFYDYSIYIVIPENSRMAQLFKLWFMTPASQIGVTLFGPFLCFWTSFYVMYRGRPAGVDQDAVSGSCLQFSQCRLLQSAWADMNCFSLSPLPFSPLFCFSWKWMINVPCFQKLCFVKQSTIQAFVLHANADKRIEATK